MHVAGKRVSALMTNPLKFPKKTFKKPALQDNSNELQGTRWKEIPSEERYLGVINRGLVKRNHPPKVPIFLSATPEGSGVTYPARV